MRKSTVWVARALALALFMQALPSLPVFQTIAMAAEAVSGEIQEELLKEADENQFDIEQDIYETELAEGKAPADEEIEAVPPFAEAEALDEFATSQAFENLLEELRTGIFYSELSDENKALLIESYVFSDKEMQLCEEAGLNVWDAMFMAMIMSYLNVSLEQAKQVTENYKALYGQERGEQIAALQIESCLEYIDVYPSITQEGSAQIKTLVMEGYKASAAVYAYIAATALEEDINNIIWTNNHDGDININLSGLSEEDAAEFLGISGIFSVRPDFLYSYMTNNGLTVLELSEHLTTCQIDLDIFVTHGKAPVDDVMGLVDATGDDESQDHPLAPFSYLSGENDRININNGELSFYDPIVSLAGKNGLDLNITLVYNSSEAVLDKLETVLKAPNYSTSHMVSGEVRIYNGPRDPNPISKKNMYLGKNTKGEDLDKNTNAKYPGFRPEGSGKDRYKIYWYITDNKQWVQEFDSFASANSYFKDDMYELTIQLGRSYNDSQRFKSGDYIAEWAYTSNMEYMREYNYMKLKPELLTEWQYKETNIVAKEGGNPFIDMGVGWSLNFSRVILEPRANRIYIQLDTGEKHELVKEGSKYVIQDTPNKYLLKDLEFAEATKADTDKVPGSKYVLTYQGRGKAGQKEYFDKNGFLLAIYDRFDNYILFKLTNSTGISSPSLKGNFQDLEITDTIGRKTTFKYSDPAHNILIEVTLPDKTVITYLCDQVDWDKGSDGKTYGRDDVYYASGKFILKKKTDAEKNVTEFAYNTAYTSTKGADEIHRYYAYDTYPSGSGGYFSTSNKMTTSVFNLTQVFYPTGAISMYEYQSMSAPLSGNMRGIYAVVKSKNGPSTAFERKYEYCLSDPENVYNYKTKVTSSATGLVTEYTFNNRGYHVETLLKSGSNKYVSTKYQYPDNTYNLPDKITTTWYSSNQRTQMSSNETFEYDSFGNLKTHIDAAGVKSTFAYDSKYNLMTKKTLKNGAVEEIYTLTSNKDLVSSVQIKGKYNSGPLQDQGTTSFAYNTDKTIKQKTVNLAGSSTPIVTNYTYTKGLYVASQTTSGVTERFTYDDMGRILTVVDGNKQTTTFTYDKLGRQLTQTNPDKTIQRSAYDDKSNKITITDENGNAVVYQYDSLGYLTSVSGGGITLQKLTYDDDRRVKTETDANNNVTSYTYDTYSRVIRKEVKQGGSTVIYSEGYKYDDAFESQYNKVTKTVYGDSSSPSIITTSYINSKGQLVKSGIMSGSKELTTIYRYNSLGNLDSDQSPKDYEAGITNTHFYDYDFAGRLTKVVTADGAAYLTAYDMLGRKISATDPNKNVITYTYDAFGNVIEAKIPFEGSYSAVTTNVYDGNNNLIKQTVLTNKPGGSAENSVTEYEYNNRNFLTKKTGYSTSGESSYVTYTYDKVGNMETMKTGNGANQTTYSYDKLNRLTSLMDPLGQTEKYTYDKNGNIETKTDRNGVVTTNTYNGLNLLTNSRTNGGDSFYYTYTATGAKRSEDSGNITTTYVYNDRGLLIKETDISPELKSVVKEYTYDSADNRTGFKLTKGGIVELSQTYEYDKLNRLIKVKQNSQTVAEYDYDQNGNRISMTYPNGISTAYTYNKANLVTGLTNKKGGTVISEYTYSYYLDGNQASKTENTGKITNYKYDGLGRLISEAETDIIDAVTKAYTYDTAGNRATLTVNGPESYVTAYAYDNNNRLLTETTDYGTYESTNKYTYDPNGNQLGMFESRIGTVEDAPAGLEVYNTGTPYQMKINDYDTYNRLIKTTTNTAVAEYTYKANGMRYSKTVDGEMTIQVWDGANIVLEADSGGVTIDTYVRGINLIQSGNNGYYIYNAHGDVVGLTDNSGNVVKDYQYDAFGVELNLQDDDVNPFRYAGEYFDVETGDIYLRNRYYSPSTGRFINEDPIRSGLNWYTYGNGNPILFIDPYGLAAGDLYLNSTLINNTQVIDKNLYGSIRDVANSYGVNVYNIAGRDAYHVVNENISMEMKQYSASTVVGVVSTTATVNGKHSKNIRYTQTWDGKDNVQILVNVQDFVDAMMKAGSSPTIQFDLDTGGGTWYSNSAIGVTARAYIPQPLAEGKYADLNNYAWVLDGSAGLVDFTGQYLYDVLYANKVLTNEANNFVVFTTSTYLDYYEGMGLYAKRQTDVYDYSSDKATVYGTNVGIFSEGHYYYGQY